MDNTPVYKRHKHVFTDSEFDTVDKAHTVQHAIKSRAAITEASLFEVKQGVMLINTHGQLKQVKRLNKCSVRVFGRGYMRPSQVTYKQRHSTLFYSVILREPHWVITTEETLTLLKGAWVINRHFKILQSYVLMGL